MSRFLIRSTTIVDGTGAPRHVGHVAVADGYFVDPGSLAPEDCDQVIDGRGLVCTPGFIDTHSHSDIQVLVDPTVPAKVRQGITTEILGQDGVAAAPLPAALAEDWRSYLSGIDGDAPGLDWGWGNTAGYLERIEGGRGSAFNVAVLAPHGNVRMQVMGLADRPASPAEIDAMCKVLEEELAAGAIGMSSGLIYVPCAFSHMEELEALCRVAAAHHKPFVVHQRSEADDIIASMEEILGLARRTGVRVHFSHFKVCGLANRHLVPRMAALLDEAREEGLQVSFDQYPYAVGSTTLNALIPPWAQSGGGEELLARLADRDTRDRITRDIRQGIHGWDNFMDFAGPDHIRVTSVQTGANQWVIGHTLSEIARERGESVYDTIYDLLTEEHQAVSICTEFGAEEDVAFFLRRPEQNVCTDGLFGGRPHPRVYGSFVRVLEKYVRQEGVLTLEEAVHKMAGRPAALFGFADRGIIRPGMRADLLLFDAGTIADHATFVEPRQYPTGFAGIWVNGEQVFDGEKTLPKCPGMILRQF